MKLRSHHNEQELVTIFVFFLTSLLWFHFIGRQVTVGAESSSLIGDLGIENKATSFVRTVGSI